MRMRKHKWAVPELSTCPYYIADPALHRGKWEKAFARPDQPLYVELGAGKCGFAAEHSLRFPNINLLCVDKITDILGVGRRTIETAYEGQNHPVDNLLLCAHDIERISLILSEQDEAERIYINFCNPWPKPKHWKKRLTHPRQLMNYRAFLKDGGEIRFKTDDSSLFEDSIGYFEQSGFTITFLTRDLHAEGREDNIETEHERMFSAEGLPIKALYARKNP